MCWILPSLRLEWQSRFPESYPSLLLAQQRSSPSDIEQHHKLVIKRYCFSRVFFADDIMHLMPATRTHPHMQVMTGVWHVHLCLEKVLRHHNLAPSKCFRWKMFSSSRIASTNFRSLEFVIKVICRSHTSEKFSTIAACQREAQTHD